MKFKNTYRLFFTIPILIFSILLTSCASLGWETVMPQINIINKFENDTWLVMDNMLINKNDGSVRLLEPDTSATIEGISYIYYHSPYTYKVEFEENAFKLYTFLETYYYPEDDLVYAFFDCVFTYNYEGHEVDRTYLSELLTEEQALSLYNTRLNKTDEFSFEVDSLWKYHKEDNQSTSEVEQEILEHIENIYNNSNDSIDTVSGSAKTIGDEIWFSVNAFPHQHLNSGAALVSGIKGTEIKSYNPNTSEFKTIYKYDKKDEAIIDFDKNGFFTFDSDSNLKYFDIDSNKSTLVYTFPYRMPDTTHAVHSFDITDDYIGINYEDGKTGYYYLVYEKGKDIVADNLYSKYSHVEN